MSFIESKDVQDRSGTPFLIRTAQPKDAEQLLEYIRRVAGETEFFIIEEDEFPPTVEDERAWIQAHLDHPDKLILVAVRGRELVGSVTFEAGAFRRVAHRGSLGLAVAQTARGNGIGTALLQALLEWAEEHSGIEKVCLDVFRTNTIAIGLYRNLGFIEEGVRRSDVKRGAGDYVDTLMMYRPTT